MAKTLIEEANEREVSYYKRDRIPLAQSIPLQIPLHIQIEPTNACNAKCFFCPVALKDYKEQSGGLHMMKLDEYKRVLDDIVKLGHLKLLSFFMIGEPFLNKHLIEMITLAKQAGVADRYQTTTNATLVTEEKWGPLCESGLDLMRCSILGIDEQRHHDRMQCNVTLQQVKDNIGGLKKFRDSHGYKKPHLTMRMHVTTPEEEAEFKRVFGEIGDEACVDFLFDWNGALGHDEEGKGKLSKVTDEKMYEGQEQFFGHHDKQVCPFPFFTLIVLPDLKVTVCSTDWSKLNVVGDLREESLTQIWQGQKLHDFQMMHLERRRYQHVACRSCAFIFNNRDDLDSLDTSVLSKKEHPLHPNNAKNIYTRPIPATAA